MRRTETAIWWKSEELRILLAHWLVETGRVDTVTGLLAYYERPGEWEAEMRECLAEMAAGQVRPGQPLTQPVVDDIKARTRANQTVKQISQAHYGLPVGTVQDVARGTLVAQEALFSA